jgi:isocitrate dehydrogenase
MNHKITLIRGDGIGPEITKAVIKILDKAGCELEYDEAIVGEQIYHKNVSSGIDEKAWEIIRRNDVMLKAPITTPMGGGYKSLNVTMRKELGLYINLRPSISYYPIIEKSPKIMDLAIVRENEEDLYAGIEYKQTEGSVTSLKLLTKAGSLKICHFAFEYARKHKRKKVTCMVKDNIMKMADGMFYKAFLEVAKNYPDIANEHYIIDIGAARIACRPQDFDIIVTENLYGDIISDIASEVSGSVGIAGSANLGDKYAMFEAIHGSAPRMAGQNSANPTAFLNGAIMMLRHLEMHDKANLINNAVFATLENGYHTKDLYVEGKSKAKMGTKEFADAIINHFGQKPKNFKVTDEENSGEFEKFDSGKYAEFLKINSFKSKKKLIGVDFFIDYDSKKPSEIADKINNLIKNSNLKLSSILSKGLKVWPTAHDKKVEFCDNWMCRFIFEKDGNHSDTTNLLDLLSKSFDVIKMEKLYTFNGENGYSAGQGE